MKTHKVVWNEGMFLEPHHFQQSSRYLENISQQRLSYYLPVTWGVFDFSVDEEAIKNGIITLDQLNAIMPDGSLIDMGGADPVPESRSFQEVFTPSVDNIDVYFAIPLYRQDSAVCSLDDDDSSKITRYKREYIKVLDENTASNERNLSIAKKNIQILFSGEALDGYSSIKIIKINRTADGYVLDENYIPPLLNIKASRPLMKIVRKILESLSSQSTELSDMRRQRSTDVADFNSSDVSNVLFLKTVNSFIPLLNHFYQSKMSTPDQLYEALVQLSGELMTFSMEGHPRDLPPYNHSDLSATFNDIDKILEKLLGKVIAPQNVISIPLEKRSENIYVGNIQDDSLLASGKFFLAIGCGDMSQADIIKYVPIKFKVSSADIILEIINSAMPGIQIRHIPIPPSSLPIKIGYEYFSIESSSDLWKRINESKSLAIYIPKDLVAVELKLIVIKG